MVSIVKITDGLWNQMSQYAFARFLEEKHNQTIVLDTTHFRINKDRSFLLGVFNSHYKIADVDDIWFTSYLNKKQKIMKFLLGIHKNFYMIWFFLFEYLIEPIFYKYKRKHYISESTYSAKDLDKKDAYYSWFWQNCKYAEEIRPFLLEELSPKITLDTKTINHIKNMEKSASISLHVRRGDYLSFRYKRIMATCSIDYYQESINYMEKHVEKPIFYVFSDDLARAKEHLQFSGMVTFIDGNSGENAWKDLWLMSKCKHNIIANSTFSRRWAWLNKNTSKIVLYPEKRLYYDKRNPIMQKFFPVWWIKM